jgi:hypothetical protein
MPGALSRRRLLISLGGAVSLAGCAFGGRSDRKPSPTSGTRSTPTGPSRTDISFDTILNAVDDLGFDNTGTEPIDSAFADAYASDTLIEFPPGTYRVATEHTGDVSRFGIRGTGDDRRDVQIVPTAGSAVKWLKAVDTGPHLVENLSFNERSDDSTQLSLWFRTTPGSVLKNVEWLGRTPEDSAIAYSLTAETAAKNGVVTLDGIYAGLDEPAKPVQYPDGVSFVRTGQAHRGEVKLKNAVIHERNSTATRFEAGPGIVTMENCEFVNNQLSSIRVAGGNHPSKQTVVRNCYVKVDGSRKTTAAVHVEGTWKRPAVFEELVVDWTNEGARGVIASPSYQPHGPATFDNCVVRNDAVGTPTVSFAAPTTTKSKVTIRNSSFSGAGGDIRAEDRPHSVIHNCCINMPNASISGFKLENVTQGGC